MVGAMTRVWIVAAVAVGLAIAWAATPLRELVDPQGLLAAADGLRATGWGIALIVPLFVLASVVMIPSSILRWTTVVAFDPWIGVPCMLLGSLGAAFTAQSRIGADAPDAASAGAGPAAAAALWLLIAGLAFAAISLLF